METAAAPAEAEGPDAAEPAGGERATEPMGGQPEQADVQPHDRIVEEAGSESQPAEEPAAEAAPSEQPTAKKPARKEAAKKAKEKEDVSATNGAESADAPKSDGPPKNLEKMDWYILKVQSNREDSIRDALLRRVKVAGLEDYFDEVIVPTETVSEYKDGKRRTRKQKLWPGYLVVHMEINEDTWFLVRETPGIGDFTGAGGKPTPMLASEVEKILRLVHPERHAAKEKAPVKIAFEIGDRVKIKEGTFQNFDGEVCGIDHANGRVTVMTEIFSRKTPVEFDYWQIERV